jgi:hypothetical protein
MGVEGVGTDSNFGWLEIMNASEAKKSMHSDVFE